MFAGMISYKVSGRPILGSQKNIFRPLSLIKASGPYRPSVHNEGLKVVHSTNTILILIVIFHMHTSPNT